MEERARGEWREYSLLPAPAIGISQRHRRAAIASAKGRDAETEGRRGGVGEVKCAWYEIEEGDGERDDDGGE